MELQNLYALAKRMVGPSEHGPYFIVGLLVLRIQFSVMGGFPAVCAGGLCAGFVAFLADDAVAVEDEATSAGVAYLALVQGYFIGLRLSLARHVEKLGNIGCQSATNDR